MDTKYLYKLLLLVFILSGTINNTFAQAPTISSFTPTSGPVGTLVTITGTNLTAPTAFSIGGAPDIIVSNTASSLVGMVMQGAITGIISITTAGGTATSISNFTVTATTYPSVQQGQKLLGTGVVPNVYQGCSVSLSADGNTAIVGGDIDAGADGAVWVYIRSGGVWTQQGPKLVGTGAIGAALQGISVSLSADGNTAIIGGYYDNSYAGAAWIFIRSGSVWAQQGPKLVGTGASISAEQGISVSISGDGNTAIIGGANDDNSVGAAWVFTRSAGVWTQQGSKLLGTGVVGAARQGSSVSLSSDGNTAIVGGTNDNGFAGATWVFTRSGVVWTQQGLKLVGLGAVGVARQGNSISLSADGNTIIVGGNGDNNYAGAAWVFTRSGVVWIQQGSKLVGTGLVGAAFQGSSVSLSADGNTAIVGGYSDNVGVGAAWIYTRSVGVWTQQGPKLIGTGTTGPAYQGTSASMSADGNTMMVGGPNNSTGAVWVFTRSGVVWTQQGPKLVGAGGIGAALQAVSVSLSADGNTAIVGGREDDLSTGAAWLYTRTGGIWSQQGLKLVGTGAVGAARQGVSISLSADGNTAIVGGDYDNNNTGAAWIFTRSGGVWTQQGSKLVGTGAVGTTYQGISVSLSADGNTAIVGGYGDDSYAGAVWVYTRSGGVWTQQGSKLVGAGAIDASQGSSVSLSADGNTVIVGGYTDDGGAGAGWIFTRSGGVWTQQGSKLTGTGAIGLASQGISVSLSANGNTAIVGGYGDDNYTGAIWIYTRSGGVWTQQGSKLTGTGSVGIAFQGTTVSLSADGNTAIEGGLYDNNNTGAAWIFTRSGLVWTQQGSKLVGTGAVGEARQGLAVSLSADGNTAVVGGPTDHGNQGAIWVYKSAFSAASDYFRSITSGNWNNPTTWESSAVADFSSGIINPATLTPDITANDINIRSSHTVTVTANVTTDQTFINPGGTLTITGSTLIVSNSGLTIQSTAAGTGRVGNSTGTISGNVNIERYIANAGHRAWHLLSAKAVTGAQTIYEAWQEAGVSGVSLPGYGTWVTSNLFTGSNGFDATSVSSSILTHIQGGAGGPSWNYGLTNTNTALSANPGYMLFVRGDRNYKPTLPTPIATSATTLRSKGVLTQGTQPAVTVSATGTGRTLVGNPYASPIDFESIQATLNLNQTFYVWDATLTGNYGVGGFVLVDRNGGVYQTTPVVLGGTNANPNSRYIHMGQAFFLKATGADASVVFTENSKASTVPIINPIVNGPGEQQLIANLMIVNPSNIESLADGIRIKYADNYSPKTNDDDEKMGNFNENISSFRDDKKWIVERRPMINGNDTIFLRITNTSIKDYRLQLGTFDFVQTDILAWLQDTYLGTNTSIDLTGSITNVDFSVTADPASANQSRFRIIFGSNTTTIPPGITGISVYPNPVVNHTIGIVFNNMDKGVYGLRLINSMGQVIFTQQLNYSGGTAKYSVHPSANIAKGIYWLECIKPNHSKLLKKLVVAEK